MCGTSYCCFLEGIAAWSRWQSVMAWQMLGSMETPLFPSEISCSLPALIWRMSLVLEDLPYLKAVAKSDA